MISDYISITPSDDMTSGNPQEVSYLQVEFSYMHALLCMALLFTIKCLLIIHLINILKKVQYNHNGKIELSGCKIMAKS